MKNDTDFYLLVLSLCNQVILYYFFLKNQAMKESKLEKYVYEMLENIIFMYPHVVK